MASLLMLEHFQTQYQEGPEKPQIFTSTGRCGSEKYWKLSTML